MALYSICVSFAKTYQGARNECRYATGAMVAVAVAVGVVVGVAVVVAVGVAVGVVNEASVGWRW